MRHLRIFTIVQRYKQVGFHLIAVFSSLLASDVFKMPSRQQRGELNNERNTSDELEFSRVPYSDPKQKRASGN